MKPVQPEGERDEHAREVTCPSETGAATAAPAITTSFAALLTGHILRDGELVLLILRPSKWFILLTSLKFLAVAAILMILSVIFDDYMAGRSRQYVQLGAMVIVARLMWGTLQWMGRLYILTDMRIIRLSGVFTLEIFDCALRRVARTLLEATFKEQVCRVGSIVIIPQDEEEPIGSWQMVARPRYIHAQIVATINRAKQGGMMR